MELRLAPLQTARLRLEPLTAETARATVAGDLSWLTAAGLAAADGWPHDDTADGGIIPCILERGLKILPRSLVQSVKDLRPIESDIGNRAFLGIQDSFEI